MNYLNIEVNKLQPITKNLNLLLASYQVYYQNLRSFHWHVKGNHFLQHYFNFCKNLTINLL